MRGAFTEDVNIHKIALDGNCEAGVLKAYNVTHLIFTRDEFGYWEVGLFYEIGAFSVLIR